MDFHHQYTDETPPVITVSFLELYNEELRDMLGNRNQAPLQIRDDAKGVGQVNIIGLSELPVHSPQELLDVLNRGSLNRTVGNNSKPFSFFLCFFLFGQVKFFFLFTRQVQLQ